jgi:hypothetical protein
MIHAMIVAAKSSLLMQLTDTVRRRHTAQERPTLDPETCQLSSGDADPLACRRPGGKPCKRQIAEVWKDLANPLNLTTPRVYHRCGQAKGANPALGAHTCRGIVRVRDLGLRGVADTLRAEASDAMDRDVNRLIPAVRSVPGHPLHGGKPATVSRTPLCVPCAGHRRIRPRHRGSSSTWGGALSCPELPGC